MKKNISILGSTGSIGKQTLEVVYAFPSSFRVAAFAAKDEVELIAAQIKTFKPSLVSVATEEVKTKVEALIAGEKVKIAVGEAGLNEVACFAESKLLVVAIPGSLALMAVMKAVEAGKDIALATKEVLVSSGDLFMEAVKAAKVKVYPIDSEHSAIAQCLTGEKTDKIKKIILTASGGPFLKTPIEKLEKMTAKEALAHPTWKMGPKITIDSATLMNKGFEVIEAHYLFNLPYEQIEVVIHPQSIIHSMVEFVDGSIKAQLGAPDMRVPIQLALFGMERAQNRWNRLDFTKVRALTFEKPDLNKFPCLGYAFDAGKKGGTLPAVVNAANEEAVKLLLKGKILFGDIPVKIKKAMETLQLIEKPTLAQIFEADSFARSQAI
ncbi:1-deoxy-D-xylulose-5-phosphate reductoisomerase [Candidatus Saganbacteria bacterium]|nr:1-deoxy-D-xylulose-5-phosphate reductoisomerase [Candidatus Saganbacteria bacterium]